VRISSCLLALLELVPCSIGEESYSAGSRPPLTDEATFCVDPIGALISLH
jgi:hypothetical protein